MLKKPSPIIKAQPTQINFNKVEIRKYTLNLHSSIINGSHYMPHLSLAPATVIQLLPRSIHPASGLQFYSHLFFPIFLFFFFSLSPKTSESSRCPLAETYLVSRTKAAMTKLVSLKEEKNISTAAVINIFPPHLFGSQLHLECWLRGQ